MTQDEMDEYAREAEYHTRLFIHDELIRLGYEPDEDQINEFIEGNRADFIWVQPYDKEYE